MRELNTIMRVRDIANMEEYARAVFISLFEKLTGKQ